MSKTRLLALIILLLFLPLLWMSLYAYPSGDDYHLAVTVRKLGIFGATKWWYFNGSGRYSYIFLQNAISGFHDWLIIYRILPAAVLVAGFGSVLYFVRTLFGSTLGAKTIALLAASLYTVLVSLTSDIATGFYWLTTSIQYVTSVFASLVVCGLLIEIARSQQRSGRLVKFACVAVLIVFIAGSNEVSALWLCGALALVNIFSFVRNRRVWPATLLCFAVAVFLSLISFFSPGTSARLNQVPSEHSFLKITGGSIAVAAYLFAEFLLAKPVLPATILYFLFLNANRDRLEMARKLFAGVRWYWIAASIVIFAIGANAIIFTAIGPNSLVDRLKNVYVYSLFFGWLVLMTTIFFEFFDEKREFRVSKWAVIALVAYLFGFLLTGNRIEIDRENEIASATRAQAGVSAIQTSSVYTNAWLDILSGRANRFAQQNRQREQELMNGDGDSIDFSLYSYVPQTVFIQDVNHPFGSPEWLTTYSCGEVKKLNLRATGPPALPKKKF